MFQVLSQLHEPNSKTYQFLRKQRSQKSSQLEWLFACFCVMISSSFGERRIRVKETCHMPPQQIAIIALNIFFSYAHEDEVLRKELEKQLSILRWLGLITEWYDRDIHAGTEWEHEINAHLDTAQIILLLISPDFLASPYCLLQH